jgi:Family of unknown function (DUF6152)
MKAAVATLVAVAAVVAATPMTAHHSFAAEYDATKPVVLKGRVTRIEWTNPHAHMFVDVTDETGAVARWKIELASPKVLAQYGWRLTSLKVGDDVTVDGAMAKDGTTSANARVVTLADGRRVSAGSSGGDLPQQ